MQMQTRK
ncbi:hypothetical protein E2C01_030983 [Portunus trituberculatus]|nr:hypothetical protein [Portunus trituberculatus]